MQPRREKQLSIRVKKGVIFYSDKGDDGDEGVWTNWMVDRQSRLTSITLTTEVVQ
jgi:hypothetical protein